MRAPRVAFVLLLAAWSLGVHAAVPRILIAPLASKTKDGPVADPALANYLAQEFDDEGRVSSIVWGMSDPVFRSAALDGKLGSPADTPTLAQAEGLLDPLGADYVLVYTTQPKDGQIKAKGELYSRGRLVWKDERAMTALLSGKLSTQDALVSIARTWKLLLDKGPFNQLAPRPKAATPEVSPGQAPKDPEIAPAVPTVSASDTAIKRIEDLRKSGNRAAAVALARESVDSFPLNAPLRKLLVLTLQEGGDLLGAAKEAHRAALLVPEDPDLRELSVRAQIQAGRTEEAQTDLNEWRARDPNSLRAIQLSGELAITALKPEVALEHAERSIKLSPNADGYFIRSLARALLGGLDGSLLDLAESEKLAAKQSPGESSARYRLAAQVLERATRQSGAAVREVIRLAAIHPKDRSVSDALDQQIRTQMSCDAFWSKLVPPVGHKKSYEEEELAQKLLSLCMKGVQEFISEGNEDSLTDARINLGEALKHANAARETFASELGVADARMDSR